MKRKIFLTFALAVLLLCSTAVCYAASTTETQCADALYELGLFKGTGVKADGSPEYSLDKTPTRAEAITMLVRLLGKEEKAKAQEWETPFTDIDAWAKPYVGYAYNNGLTTGTSATTFGSNEKATETQYLTFVLRALGYSDKDGDFSWDKAKELTNELDITYGDADTKFLRGDVVEISYMALKAKLKDSDTKLIDSLYETGAVKTSEIAKVVRDKVSEDGTKIYLPDEIADGINSKDYARAYGFDENIYFIVNPKTDNDYYNNLYYSILTGDYDFCDTADNYVWRVKALDIQTVSIMHNALMGSFANVRFEFVFSKDNKLHLVCSSSADSIVTADELRDNFISAYKIAKGIYDNVHKKV